MSLIESHSDKSKCIHHQLYYNDVMSNCNHFPNVSFFNLVKSTELGSSTNARGFVLFILNLVIFVIGHKKFLYNIL